MTEASGILSYGVYLPRKRLQRAAIHAANGWFAPGLEGLARGERTIADWDEDSVTMAVEAARAALEDHDRQSITGLSLASTTLPFADRLNAGIVKEALNLPDDVAAYDLTGSQRAATSGLAQALQAAGRGVHLALAGELRKARPASEAEMTQGDGAAALLVGRGKVIARHLGSRSVTIDFVDHYRMTRSDFDYHWEARWIRDEGYLCMIGEALRDALGAMDIAVDTVDHLIVPVTARGVGEGIAKRVGIRSQALIDPLLQQVGDTGAAHPLLMLSAALERAKPGQVIVLIGFGQGVDIVAFETTAALADLPGRRGVASALDRRMPDDNYPRYLFHRGLLDLDRGMRAEFDQKQPGTTLWRHRKAVLGLVGGRCTQTGVVQFPKSDVSVGRNDHAVGTQQDYPLAELPARIVTYTADRLTYSPAPPSYYGVIDFEGGGRMMTEFADATEDQIEVGCAMRMVFRIKAFDEQRDFVKYFWKAAPAN
ncbi:MULTISPECIES: hydroxymethylglutaryl-CoA synthase family protein [unclassified Sphingomonas]|uniref:hydroxymethylglutaryl-CoA synthase family protein n=1 Tax=unclassified Sphingomonas TaxID=196159 RepID=UPI0006F86636|nr:MULTISPECIES: OB-fold domain-containing protein [unclassified Sphingomonas]KQX18597.1 3-hydroxy-3-methylglutaryl CoA synthase [Sphingomonas sp. Root1294]KQY72080.1 3-hydroxy-3-methylglutaryl CoA synthase [Sphingomonas sp. Root50]KRB94651.1 3-hydroxy-3-methylglutaryl CoA synthase [Sphingomonas sp. Root720]